VPKSVPITIENSQKLAHELSAGQILVVPQGVWHRFECPDGVKVMTITPQPTEHSLEHPNDR
jgi:mannose-6-phosphate isomerase-like protein (cupin superfamily)